MNRTRLNLAAAAALATAFVAIPASAAPIVTNGSFETGDFTGWLFNGSATVPNEVSVYPDLGSPGFTAEDGTYFAQMGAPYVASRGVVTPVVMSQQVTDTIGALTLNY